MARTEGVAVKCEVHVDIDKDETYVILPDQVNVRKIHTNIDLAHGFTSPVSELYELNIRETARSTGTTLFATVNTSHFIATTSTPRELRGGGSQTIRLKEATHVSLELRGEGLFTGVVAGRGWQGLRIEVNAKGKNRSNRPKIETSFIERGDSGKVDPVGHAVFLEVFSRMASEPEFYILAKDAAALVKLVAPTFFDRVSSTPTKPTQPKEEEDFHMTDVITPEVENALNPALLAQLRLVRDNFTLVSVKFKQTDASTYTYLAPLGMDLQPGDKVLVPSTSTYRAAIVDSFPDKTEMDTSGAITYVWIVQKIDTSVFDQMREEEKKGVSLLLQTLRSKEREQLRKAIIDQFPEGSEARAFLQSNSPSAAIEHNKTE